jgi:hypothetical protein
MMDETRAEVGRLRAEVLFLFVNLLIEFFATSDEDLNKFLTVVKMDEG